MIKQKIKMTKNKVSNVIHLLDFNWMLKSFPLSMHQSYGDTIEYVIIFKAN